ncbi:GntR family transcriptional regulator [Pseudomonas sp. MG-9]|uniref:GntR family transcriptional regulator n=1 Tax=Pseudomonas serboccidentalis TaxID=2964670 RepID=A0ABY7ZFU6_9PSED|nr:MULTISPECIES: GntR family transcriptional regulator [Pseudomonas]MBT9267340.1 GntR family transcriptional regulator [Pseudomonas sp. MG-9]WDR38486.1 GntR family transcriptional regulator [Pseudomonas serboccidentalis]
MNSFASLQYDRKIPATLPFPRGPRHKPLADDPYPQVFEAILDQRLTATSRFTEESLVQMFGASRSQIRRTLTQLSHEHVVILRTHQRPKIATATPEQTRQILHARRLTEIMLLELTCQQLQPAALEGLRELIEEQRRFRTLGQFGAAIRLSGEFHLQLAKLAGNAPLAHFLGSLVPMTSLALAQCRQQTNQDTTVQTHTSLVDAMERNDVNAAAHLMNRHLSDLEQQLLGSAP